MSDLKITKNGIDVPVRVNAFGKFTATVGNDDLESETWTEMGKKIDKATKKVVQTIKVPFTRIRFSKPFGSDKTVRNVDHGTATGLHSGNGNVLGKWDSGESFQMSGYDRADLHPFRRLTQEEADEYTSLWVAQRRAQRELDTWEKEHEIDLKASVVTALNEGAKAAE